MSLSDVKGCRARIEMNWKNIFRFYALLFSQNTKYKNRRFQNGFNFGIQITAVSKIKFQRIFLLTLAPSPRRQPFLAHIMYEKEKSFYIFSTRCQTSFDGKTIQ